MILVHELAPIQLCLLQIASQMVLFCVDNILVLESLDLLNMLLQAQIAHIDIWRQFNLIVDRRLGLLAVLGLICTNLIHFLKS